jgi:hypothetical protein
MKTNIRKAVVLALAAAFFLAPGGLLAQDTQSKWREYIGIKGGLSLLPDASASAAYPGIYPNKPVFGIFYEVKYSDEAWHSEWVEVLYLDQCSVSDVILRDDVGNIIAEHEVECSRKYLEFLLGGKLRSKYEAVTPFLSAGGAISVLLKTSRKPDIVDPEQPKFKGPVFSAVLGLGVDASVGRLFLSLEVRADLWTERAFSDRKTPKPDAVLIIAGIGF